jgi:monofunctional biosynthetic peptidoglycan transglycosylase
MASFRRTSSFLAAFALIAGLAVGVWLVLPPRDLEAYARGAPPEWSMLRERRLEHPKLVLRHAYLPLSRMPVDLPLAVICGEDGGFLDHGAFDVEAIREAVDEWQKGAKLRGASTLTQQLAKNLFLSDNRSWLRKAREARYAYWVDERLGKRRILELYLNVVELGEGVFGVESGAQLYFGVSAADLDANQAAQLAAAIPSPFKHNPATRTGTWRIRYQAIHLRMEQYAWIRDALVTMQAGTAQKHRAAPPAASPRPPAAVVVEGTTGSEASAPGAGDVAGEGSRAAPER